MPNKFSHALVLSTYESRGLIDLPPPLLPSLHPAPPTEQNRPSSDDATTPSLSALPGLASDSSTASINSSLDLHPSRPPIHVPSFSSIVTEVYAPQSSPLEPQTTVAAAEDHLSDLHSPLHSKQSPPASSKPTSRFSSLHSFSAFLDLPSHVKRHRRRPRQHSRRHDSPPDHIVPVTSTAKTPPPPPQNAHPHNPPSGRPHPDNKQQQHYLPHSRLHPILSSDSLRSRHHTHADEKDTPRPQSPNMDVLPWEYPSSDPPPPLPRPLSPAPHLPHVLIATTTTTATPNIPPHPRSASLSHPPLPSLHTDDPPASDETDPIFKPIFPTDEELLPGEPRVESPRSRAESFDSAAPPPIRKGPWGVPGGKSWSVK